MYDVTPACLARNVTHAAVAGEAHVAIRPLHVIVGVQIAGTSDLLLICNITCGLAKLTSNAATLVCNTSHQFSSLFSFRLFSFGTFDNAGHQHQPMGSDHGCTGAFQVRAASYTTCCTPSRLGHLACDCTHADS